MSTVTIPKSITGKEELVVLPKRVFDELLKEKGVTEKDILTWSYEAKKLKQRGKLLTLKSLKSLY